MPSRHALLIGNSKFRHKNLARLSAPANDVRDLAKLLEDPEIGGFTIELKIDIGLVDARQAIRDLFDQRHPDDLLLFYYSGHGLEDARGNFYLAMTETDPANPDAGSIDDTWLRGIFNGSPSRRQVAILDCCHSGAFIPGDQTSKDATNRPILTEKTFDPSGHGRFVMAATTAKTSAFEQDGRSLYTRHLVEGLAGGAAAPENDSVTVFDLHEFVKRRVAETAPAFMRPQLWRDASIDPDAQHLAIARNPRPRPKLPDDEVSKLWADDQEAVELAIFRLIEIARGEDSLAEDARKVLGERLKASDTLSYKLGERIAEFLGVGGSRDALADAELRLAEAKSRAAMVAGQLAALEQDRNRLKTALKDLNEKYVQELGSLSDEISRLEQASADRDVSTMEKIASIRESLQLAEAEILTLKDRNKKLVQENRELRQASLYIFVEKTKDILLYTFFGKFSRIFLLTLPIILMISLAVSGQLTKLWPFALLDSSGNGFASLRPTSEALDHLDDLYFGNQTGDEALKTLLANHRVDEVAINGAIDRISGQRSNPNGMSLTGPEIRSLLIFLGSVEWCEISSQERIHANLALQRWINDPLLANKSSWTDDVDRVNFNIRSCVEWE